MRQTKKPASQARTAGDFLKHCAVNNNKKLQPCKKFSPYSKRLYTARRNGYQPNNDIFLFIGKFAWQKASGLASIANVLLLPENDSPSDYNWNMLKGLPVLVYDMSGMGAQLIRQLAYELLKSGATVVRVIAVNYKLAAIFRRNNTGVNYVK